MAPVVHSVFSIAAWRSSTFANSSMIKLQSQFRQVKLISPIGLLFVNYSILLLDKFEPEKLVSGKRMLELDKETVHLTQLTQLKHCTLLIIITYQTFS